MGKSVLEIIINGEAGDAEQAIGAVTKSAQGLGNLVTGTLSVAFGNLLAPAISAAKDALFSFLGEAIDAQETMAGLKAVLKSTHGEAGITSEAALELAQNLRDLAGGSDDAVIGVEAVLLRFQKISKDTFPAATRTALDLAAALGIDMESAALMLGKALETPGEGLMRLKQAGVAFTDQQEKQIQALVKSGKVSEAQNLIMAALAETTGGAATEKAKTFSGQWEIAKNHLLDIGEAVGGIFPPMLQSGLAGVMPVIDRFGELLGTYLPVLKLGFDQLWPSVEKFVTALGGALGLDLGQLDLGQIVQDAVVGFGLLLQYLGRFLDFLSAELPGALSAAQSFLQPLIDAALNLASAFVESFPQMQESGAQFAAWLQQAFGTIAPQILENLTTGLNALAEFWRQHGDTIIQIVGGALAVLSATVGGALTLLTGAITAGLQYLQGVFAAWSLVLQGDWAGAWSVMQATLAAVWQTITDTLAAFMNLALSLVGTDLETFVATWRQNWEMLRLIVSTVTMQITSGFQAWIISTINSAKQFATDLIAVLKGFYDLFVAVGQDWFSGLTKGILSMVTQLQNAVVDTIKNTIKMARETLGIASPSAVFADIGEQMMTGLAGGIRTTLNTPQQAMAGAMSSITNQTVNNVSNFNVTANYANAQSESALRDDIALLQMIASTA